MRAALVTREEYARCSPSWMPGRAGKLRRTWRAEPRPFPLQTRPREGFPATEIQSGNGKKGRGGRLLNKRKCDIPGIWHVAIFIVSLPYCFNTLFCRHSWQCSRRHHTIFGVVTIMLLCHPDHRDTPLNTFSTSKYYNCCASTQSGKSIWRMQRYNFMPYVSITSTTRAAQGYALLYRSAAQVGAQHNSKLSRIMRLVFRGIKWPTSPHIVMCCLY